MPRADEDEIDEGEFSQGGDASPASPATAKRAREGQGEVGHEPEAKSARVAAGAGEGGASSASAAVGPEWRLAVTAAGPLGTRVGEFELAESPALRLFRAAERLAKGFCPPYRVVAGQRGGLRTSSMSPVGICLAEDLVTEVRTIEGQDLYIKFHLPNFTEWATQIRTKYPCFRFELFGALDEATRKWEASHMVVTASDGSPSDTCTEEWSRTITLIARSPADRMIRMNPMECQFRMSLGSSDIVKAPVAGCERVQITYEQAHALDGETASKFTYKLCGDGGLSESRSIVVVRKERDGVLTVVHNPDKAKFQFTTVFQQQFLFASFKAVHNCLEPCQIELCFSKSIVCEGQPNKVAPIVINAPLGAGNTLSFTFGAAVDAD